MARAREWWHRDLPEADCDGDERRSDGGATDGGLEYLGWCRFLGITGEDGRHLPLLSCERDRRNHNKKSGAVLSLILA